MRFAALVVFVLVTDVATAVPTQSSPPPSTNPCAIARQWQAPSVACTSFETVGIRILGTFPHSAFGKDDAPDNIAVLDDGTVLVHTQHNGLFRIVNGRINMVWRPRGPCGPCPWTFGFEQAFDDELLARVTHYPGASWMGALRADGSFAFRWPPTPTQIDAIVKGADGVIWALEGTTEPTLLVYYPGAKTVTEVNGPDNIAKIFRSPDGRVYLSNAAGLFVLESRPKAHARMVRRSITGPFQAVGRDGSLWATTPYEVLHVHPDGRIVRIQLRDPSPPNTISHVVGPPPNIVLTMTPDGAVWTTSGSVRIGNDDRITSIKEPQGADHGDVHFGPDSTMWVLARDGTDASGQPINGIVNFAPASALHGDAWPFKSTASPIPPTPFVPCTPPPTPLVPLPPRTGPVYYVCAATDNPGGVWAYWAGADGRLKPARGSPYSMDATLIAIDPSGRFAYGATWYNGIFAYRIDAASGALHAIAGSPFQSGAGRASITFDTAGTYAYANNLNAKTVGVYTINEATGALRPIIGSPFAVNGWPLQIVLDEKLHVAYVPLGGSVTTYSDARRGFRLLATTRFDHDDAGESAMLGSRHYGDWPQFTYVWHHEATQYEIDPQNGSIRSVAQSHSSANRDVVVESPDSRFAYVAALRSKANLFAFSVDPRNGTLTRIAGSPFSGADDPEELATTPDGKVSIRCKFFVE